MYFVRPYTKEIPIVILPPSRKDCKGERKRRKITNIGIRILEYKSGLEGSSSVMQCLSKSSPDSSKVMYLLIKLGSK